MIRDKTEHGTSKMIRTLSALPNCSCLGVQHSNYLMHWQGVNSEATPEFSNFYLAICRFPELIRERVWKTIFFSHSCISFRNRDLV